MTIQENTQLGAISAPAQRTGIASVVYRVRRTWVAGSGRELIIVTYIVLHNLSCLVMESFRLKGRGDLRLSDVV